MAQQIRIIRYIVKFKGRHETILGAFTLHTDCEGYPSVAFPIDVTGKTQGELTRLIADLWEANQKPPIEYPHFIDYDVSDVQNMVWLEKLEPV